MTFSQDAGGAARKTTYGPAMVALVVVVGLLTQALSVSGRMDGAPNSTCQSLMPAHGSALGVNPYRLVVALPLTYKANSDITVTVMGDEFLGIIMQMRVVGQTNIVGKWTQVAMDTRTMKCTDEDNTVTHMNVNPKNNSTFTWKAPAEMEADLEFVATIAKSKSMWAMNVKAGPFKYTMSPAHRAENSAGSLRGSNSVLPVTTLVLCVIRLFH